jgi:hypothetical protein
VHMTCSIARLISGERKYLFRACLGAGVGCDGGVGPIHVSQVRTNLSQVGYTVYAVTRLDDT